VVAEAPPAPVVALAPEPVLLAADPPAPAPAPVVEDAPVEPLLVPVVPAVPLAVPLGVGFAAPISPAAVPGPARPALSVSAGEPDAAYAPATAADMQPATNVNMSLFIPTSRV
jgi:translation initiation factor IF-2